MRLTDTISNNSGNNDFYGLVYDELRRLAHSKMSKEHVYSTLQGTALVNEAWIKLGGEEQPNWENRAHFFKAASEAMRRILIDRARKRKSKRHGGDLQRVETKYISLDGKEMPIDDKLLAVNDALEKFAEQEAEKAELIKLRFFFGMSIDEAADTLNISRTTAKRWWNYSRSWLFTEISENSEI